MDGVKHGGLRFGGGIMIGETLFVNRKITIDGIKKGAVINLDSYRRQPPRESKAVQHTNDGILLLLRKLAPGFDDRRLTDVIDGVARAWARSCVGRDLGPGGI